MTVDMTVKKKIALFLAALAVLMIPALALHLQRGVTIQDTMLIDRGNGVFRRGEQSIAMTPFEGGAEFAVALGNQHLTCRLTAEQTAPPREDDLWSQPVWQVRAAYSDGSVLEGQAIGDGWLTDEQGRPLWMKYEYDMSGIVIVTSDERHTQGVSLTHLTDALWDIYRGQTERRGVWWFVPFCAVIYLIGMATAIWPEQMHFLFTRWKYAHAELSYDGEMMEKFGGWVGMILAAGMMYLPLWL